MRRYRIWLIALLLCVVMALMIECGVIAGYGLLAGAVRADVAIVYGNRIEPDGQPCARLAARLDCARVLYEKGLCSHILVSGGTGIEGFDEAQVMRAYLLERGVPETAMTTDSTGVDSRATAKNAAALMKAQGWQSAVVVTQYWHILRARIACRQAGISLLGSAYPSYFELRDLYSIAREMVAVPVYLIGPGE